MASIRDNDLLDKWLMCSFGVDQETYRAALEEIQSLRDEAVEREDAAAAALKAALAAIAPVVEAAGKLEAGITEAAEAFGLDLDTEE